MKIWLIENNVRTGPFELFEIRQKLDNGTIDSSTPAWFKGMEDWGKVSDIPALSSSTTESNSEPDEETTTPEPSPQNNSLEDIKTVIENEPNSIAIVRPAKLYAVRRFFARFLDITMFMAAYSIILANNGVNPFIPTEHPFLELLVLSLYVIFDAVSLHLLRTTPGKYVLGVDLKFGSHDRPPLLAALGRSYRVWFWGLGMLKIMILTIPLAAFFAKRMGNFAWDLTKPHYVTCSPLSATKVALYIVCMFATSLTSTKFIPMHFYMESESMRPLIEMIGKPEDEAPTKQSTQVPAESIL